MNQHFQAHDTVYAMVTNQHAESQPEKVPGVVTEVFGNLMRVELARKKRGNWSYEFRVLETLSLTHRPKGSAPMDNQRLPLSYPRG